MSRRIRLVDVFGERPMTGNPLAVVVDAEDLSTEQMQQITRWIGFSETTFLLPADAEGADYRVRIFTLAGELPFAGHPTLGTFHVWQSLAANIGNDVVQQCGAGLVNLRRADDWISFEAPPLIRDGPVEPGFLGDLASVLGIDRAEIRASRWVDNGPGWVGILLEDADAVLDLRPDFSRYHGKETLDIGVVGFYREGWEFLYEVRAFFTGQRGEMREDPVTGSLNASVGQWLLSQGLVRTPYVASQGRAVGRSGRLHISGDPTSLWVGGRVFDLVDGTLEL